MTTIAGNETNPHTRALARLPCIPTRMRPPQIMKIRKKLRHECPRLCVLFSFSFLYLYDGHKTQANRSHCVHFFACLRLVHSQPDTSGSLPIASTEQLNQGRNAPTTLSHTIRAPYGGRDWYSFRRHNTRGRALMNRRRVVLADIVPLSSSLPLSFSSISFAYFEPREREGRQISGRHDLLAFVGVSGWVRGCYVFMMSVVWSLHPTQRDAATSFPSPSDRPKQS